LLDDAMAACMAALKKLDVTRHDAPLDEFRPDGFCGGIAHIDAKARMAERDARTALDTQVLLGDPPPSHGGGTIARPPGKARPRQDKAADTRRAGQERSGQER